MREKIRLHFVMLIRTLFATVLIPAAASFILAVVTHDPLEVARIHILLLLPVLFYFIRAKVRHFIPFLLLHLICAAAVCLIFILPKVRTLGLVLCAAGSAGLILYSFILKLHEAQGDISMAGALATLGLLSGLYVLSDMEFAQAGDLLHPYYLGMALVLVVMYFFNLHEENVNSTLYNVNEMISQPVRKIQASNQRILGVFLVGAMAIIVLAVAVRADKLVAAVIRFLLQVIAFIMSVLSGKGGGSEEWNAGYDPYQNSDPDLSFLGPPKTSQFWIVMEYVVFAAVGLAVAFGIIYGLYRFFRWFYSRRLMDVSVDEFEESRVFLEETPQKKPKRGSFFDRFRWDNRSRVRRAYRKMLIGPIREGKKVSVSDSPGEILRKLPSEALERLTPLYEKARYSQEEITSEEIRGL